CDVSELWASVSYVRLKVLSSSTREESKKIPPTSLGSVASRDLRPLGVGLPLRPRVNHPAPGTARRFPSSHSTRRNAILLGARRPKFCQRYDGTLVAAGLGFPFSSACGNAEST